MGIPAEGGVINLAPSNEPCGELSGEARNSSMKSLYIHFPFCEAKCHYCDFYSLGRERTRPGDTDRFEAALHQEIQKFSHRLAPKLDTIFFGGGTPSMTAYDSMARALEPLWASTSVDASTEWTMEANPSSISLAAFQSFRKLGINRISMGVQALRPDFLKLLGRVHSKEQALQSLQTVFDAGFTNVSVDLLCGVPGQSLADLEDAMNQLTQFPITHLSCYLLTLAPHHKMFTQLPHEDVQLEHLLFIDQWMNARGFSHYEISNFAKDGKKSRHNLNYWQGQSYLGLGPSAHSYDALEKRRWKNVSSLHKYAQLLTQGDSPEEWSETLTPTQLDLEKWMLQLRLKDGFPKEWLKSPGQMAKAKEFKTMGLLEDCPTTIEQDCAQEIERIRLTAKGFALADQIIRAFS